MKIVYNGADTEINNPVIGNIRVGQEVEITDEQWEKIKSNINFTKVKENKRKEPVSGGND